MFIKRFVRPKWQHPDPEVRRQALTDIGKNDPAVAEVALRDSEPGLRSTAVCACADLAVLGQVWRKDPDPGVRTTALRRIGVLLAAGPATPDSQAQRLELLAQIDDQRVLTQVARQAVEPDLRAAAAARVEDAEVLVEIACGDGASELRLGALERLTDTAHLERVARAARNRDKGLYRRARELLDAARATAERPRRIAELCAQMEAFGDGRATLSNAALKEVGDAWQALQVEPGNPAGSRFEAAAAKAAELLREQQALHHDRQVMTEVCAELEAAWRELQPLRELDDEACAGLDQRLVECKQRWHASADKHPQPDLERGYLDLLQRLGKRREILHQHHQRASACRHQLDVARKLLEDPALNTESARRWAARYEQLPPPAEEQLAAELRAQGKDMAERLAQRARANHEQLERTLAELDEQAAALGRLLEQGQLQPAVGAHDRLRHALDALGGLPAGRRRRLQGQLKEAGRKIRELRGWRRWGSDQAREELIEEACGLPESGLAPPELAAAVRALRERWRKLDKTDSATNEKLWERFNEACTKAYAPCEAYFASRSEQREAEVAARGALCDQLQAYAAEIDWEAPDWHGIDRQLGRWRHQWREMAPLGGKERRQLERRFHALMDEFEARLAPERERNLALRRSLIEQAAALVEREDLAQAIDQAKGLQQAWIVTVAARRRRDDQALWREFRGHIDAVFARRDAAADRQRQDREAAAAALQALCERCESLAAEPAGEPATVLAELHRLQRDRQALGGLPRDRESALRQRFAAAEKRVEGHVARLRESARRQRLAAYFSAAEICDELERAALGADPELSARREVAAAAWGELAAREPQVTEQLAPRYGAAAAMAAGDAGLDATLETNRRQLAQLVLRLEILTGVDSPPELQRERLAMQVDRLTAVIGDGRGDAGGKDEAAELLRRCCLIGPLDPIAGRPLQERMQTIRASLH